jgi:uncharacterized membrane protein
MRPAAACLVSVVGWLGRGDRGGRSAGVRTEWLLLIGWVAFAGTHVGGSSRLVRPGAVRLLGLRGFKAAYSLVALVTLGWLVATYWTQRHAGVLLFESPGWMRHVAELLMLAAFVIAALGIAQPSAASSMAELGVPVPKQPRGIQRITRHPVNSAFALFGIAHALVNTTTGDWIFWLGWPVFTLVAALHQDARRRDEPELREFFESTSVLPFAAILSGRQRFAWRELSAFGAFAGLLLFVAVRLFHGALIGGFEG